MVTEGKDDMEDVYGGPDQPPLVPTTNPVQGDEKPRTEVPPQRIERVAKRSKSAAVDAVGRAKGLSRAPKRRDVQETEEQAEAAARAAKRLQERLAARRAEIAHLASEESDENFIWYVRCPEPNCGGPGIWIHRRPFGVLKASDWSASYKPRGVMWPGHRESPPPVYCQCCHEEGRTVELRMLHQRGELVANPRWVEKITREEYEELIEGPEPVTAKRGS